jgi:hypothetical protein
MRQNIHGLSDLQLFVYDLDVYLKIAEVRREAGRPRRRSFAVAVCGGGAVDDHPPAAEAPARCTRGGRCGGRGAGEAVHPGSGDSALRVEVCGAEFRLR